MKYIYTILLLCITGMLALAQNYGNEWINYSQSYYKFPITKAGIYRLTRSSFNGTNFPIDAINPQTIQIFGFGKEIPLYIKDGQSPLLFEADDYIEFFARGNDATLDSAMYRYNSKPVNEEYSLINDTIFYYITWNNSTNNSRYTLSNDTNYSAYSPAPYCWIKLRTNFNSSYYTGTESPFYTEGEGWFESKFGLESVNYNKSFATSNLYTNGPPSEFLFSLSGVSNAAASGNNHHLRVSSLFFTYDSLFTGYKNIRKKININSAELSGGLVVNFAAVDDLNLLSDYMALSFVELKYPSQLKFGAEPVTHFQLPVFGTSKSLLQISGLSGNFVLYVPNSKTKLNLVNDGSFYKGLLPETGQLRDCWLINVDSIKNISAISPVTATAKFTAYHQNTTNAQLLIIAANKLSSSATMYKNYRVQKGTPTTVVLIDELFDQYALGVKKHPMAIKNFVRKIKQDWSSVPTHLLLIGKGVHAVLHRNNPGAYSVNALPTMGNPGSDNLLTEELGSSPLVPLLATGRIAASTNEEVQIYLDKVVEFENNQPAEWMKNVLHFGGGADAAEQSTILGYLTSYKNIIQGPYFAGQVHTFLKNSSQVIQITQSDTIRNLINNGVSLMTFFGHAAGSGFDQNIDNPSTYENKGKYPFLFANSCLVGDIFQASTNSTSEDWTLIPNKGVIGFLASSGQAFLSYLNGYASNFYNNFSHDNYCKTIGTVINNTIADYASAQPDEYLITTTCMEFTLHGDPLIVLNSQPKPDIMINESSINFNPHQVSTEYNTFELHVILTNLGHSVDSAFSISINRIYPNNMVQEYTMVLNNLYFKDTIHLTLPTDLVNGPGLNKIQVRVDNQNSIDEFNENNNYVEKSFYIISSDLIPIYPPEFAIYPNNHVTLTASSGNPFAGTETYQFQIDTNDVFTNPIATSTITQSGGVISWSPSITLTDSTVYYWRVKISNSNSWRESSFIYINGKTGWSQAHFFQYKNDEFTVVDYNRNNRSFDFSNTPKKLHCHNLGVAYNENDFRQIQWDIDGSVLNGLGDYSCCGAGSAIIVAVIDPKTLRSWESDRGAYGQRNYPRCPSRGRNDYYFVFSTDAASLNSMADFIYSIPNDFHIMIYSFRGGQFQNWPSTASDALGSLGLNVSTIPNSYPAIFYAQKGHTNTALQQVGSSSSDVIDLWADLPINSNYGEIKSGFIGPASNWQSLHWRFKQGETDHDSIQLNVYGIDASNNESLIFSLHPDSLDIYDLDQRINNSAYNEIKLETIIKDDTLHTPNQMVRWQVVHEGIPETAINTQKAYFFHNDTMVQGDAAKFCIAFENISDYNMDSLLVKYWLVDKNNLSHTLKYKKLKPHPAHDVIIDTISFSTLSYPGLNSIWVEANPMLANGNYDQPERYHFNNIAQKFFYVQSDEQNPILDVTFDGVHIMNGDVVSAKPEIVIQLKDENRYIALDDTTLFGLYLTIPDSTEDQRIYFSNNANQIINFTPASLPDNKFKIYYKPVLTKDGTYKFRVQAKDKSGNESGAIDYIISFEVINKSTVTNVFNYPNPFSTATRFVFELTGAEIPEDFRIQIFTITGKLVKTVSRDELGNIHIGKNITDYVWDGTDEYGDKLANGVYFYRVDVRTNGADVEKRTTDGDMFFKNGFGKMYIMR